MPTLNVTYLDIVCDCDWASSLQDVTNCTSEIFKSIESKYCEILISASVVVYINIKAISKEDIRL